MDYQKIHDLIIQKALSENRKKSSLVYYENHHILPRSLKGKNTVENLVFLTAKEHYVIHHLLTKIYTTGYEHQSMIRAFHRLCHGNKNKYTFITPRIYEKLRKDYAKVVSETMSGELHPMFGKKHSNITKQKMSVLRFERIHKGTKEGNRNPHTDIAKEKMRIVKLGKKMSEETKEKHRMRETNRGIWWNNGTKNRKSIDSPGIEWQKGMIKRVK